MATTVLHISDLHRDPGSGVTTTTLLESLRRDRDRYVAIDPALEPDIAVVSGDIAYGVSGEDADADAKLRKQYAEAADFLIALTNQFFDGDRERVVLVPGNHDVSHTHVLRASEVTELPTEVAQRAMLARQLRDPDSVWRWIWPEFKLRRIHDMSTYHRRLQPFADFYKDFYKGTRSFPIEPAAQYAVHDFAEHRLVIVALSSCYTNDLFNRIGRIHPDCVASATRAVDPYIKHGRVALATWHHNLAGGPHDSDYVDADVLQSLIDGGFVIGLHGHQHRPQYLEHRFTADRERAISVMSAGTLCGGPSTLPTGRMRSYNLVVVDPEAKTSTLHVRDMKNTMFELPVWGAAHVAEFSGSSITFELSTSARPASIMNSAGEAAELLRRGDAAGAFALVRPYMQDDLARRVGLEALQNSGDWTMIRALFNPPRSVAEFIALADALYELREKEELAELIETDFAKNTKDLAIRQCVDQAQRRCGGR